MSNGQRVLVIDELTQTAEVLRAVLGPRGVRVEQPLRRATPTEAHPSTSEFGRRLSVVVVDEETATVRGFDRRDWRDVPQVFIANAPSRPERTGPTFTERGAPTRYLSKPFHYADLVRAIESLIADRAE